MSSIEGIEDPFGPGTAGGTALLEREETQLSEPGDHERFSHYVRRPFRGRTDLQYLQ